MSSKASVISTKRAQGLRLNLVNLYQTTQYSDDERWCAGWTPHVRLKIAHFFQ